MRELIGFNSNPLCIIWWHQDGEAQTKTVCYTEGDLKCALDRFHTAGDFYNTYELAVVDYGDEIIECPHFLRKGA